MIWATVSSWSCFCWLYSASPSLAAKNIFSLILVLTIWWCPCVVFSYVVGRACLLWPVHSLGKTVLVFALLHFVLQGQICLLLQVSLDFLLLLSSPLSWKGHLFWVSDLSCFSCVQLCRILRTVALQASLSMGFSGNEYWSELPCTPPGNHPNPDIQPESLTPALACEFFSTSATWEAQDYVWKDPICK